MGELPPEWLIWYGMKVGLTYDQALTIPIGELKDYIAIEQVKHEGAILCGYQDDEDIIPDLR